MQLRLASHLLCNQGLTYISDPLASISQTLMLPACTTAPGLTWCSVCTGQELNQCADLQGFCRGQETLLVAEAQAGQPGVSDRAPCRTPCHGKERLTGSLEPRSLQGLAVGRASNGINMASHGFLKRPTGDWGRGTID